MAKANFRLRPPDLILAPYTINNFSKRVLYQFSDDRCRKTNRDRLGRMVPGKKMDHIRKWFHNNWFWN